MQNKNKKLIASFLLFYGLFFILIINILKGNFKFDNSYAIENNYGSEVIIKSSNTPSWKQKIKFSFIGDSLLASFKGINTYGNFQDLLEVHNYNYPFSKVMDIFQEDDYTIANSENVFTDRNLNPTMKNHNPAYWYYTRTRFANVYKESSIEILSVMNNHTYDYGNDGYNDTVNALENLDLLVGKEEPLILEKENIKIGLICTNLFHEFQANNVNNQIKNIRDKVNYIIIYFHGGTEYQHQPTDEIVKYSRNFIDNGADLVIGCHPHVLQPIEEYKGKTILYSLGSFIFGGSNNLENRSIIYQVNLEFDSKNDTYKQNTNIIPCYLYSSNEGYEKWLPSVIQDENEKQKVIDFMNNKRKEPV